MKRVFVLFFSLLQLIPQSKGQKQDEDVFYIFDKDWNSAKNFDEAAYFMQPLKENDTTFICKYYNKMGPMLKQESYYDENLTIPNGRFCWYNENGDLDSIGMVDHGRKNDGWYYYRNNKPTAYERYEFGKWIERKDYDGNLYTNREGKRMTLEEKRIEDSLISLATDTTITIQAEQIEAKFKNGAKDWSDYISKNLKTPDRLISVLGRGKFTVIVAFVVDKEGKTGDVYLIHSCEWSGDNEVVNLIKNSPKWQPAKQNGRLVYYRQKQSVTYQVN